jgi:RHS repeat-associated protein
MIPAYQRYDGIRRFMHGRYKFTGKERDAESGLDYFGARYYASNMGRFMSPDWAAKAEPVPYAKLDNPQSLNLYSYVGNNPLSRFDPDGHYQCSGSKDQCAQIKTGLDLAKAAMNKLGADTKEGKAIGAVLKFYGSATDKNGVNVAFGDLKKGTPGVTSAGENGTVNIKFDLKQINAGATNSDRGGVFGLSERVGTEIHEGTHGTDIRKWGGGPTTREQVYSTEHHAYTTESFVYRGLGVNSSVDLSSPQAIDAAAARSVAQDCAGGACKP